MTTNILTTRTIGLTVARGIGRRVCGLLLVGIAVVALLLAGGNSAHAASPGVFNNAECIPSYKSVTQNMEVYRSTASEYVVLQGALVNRATGATFYSEWAVGTGSTAMARVRYQPTPAGSYNVWYHWAVWDSGRRQWVLSGWIQVTGVALNTFGAESSPGSGVYIGGAYGQCTI